ncbi:histone-lysine N-methyltransferase ASH1L [Exophiala viscosa]|uniref:histone-lysine N-methyltransferase ASH1L n=1 Tax=Exophiala viscosa TaxID=2486360 RepID=UPI002195D7B6|nr:histone-lysine N-methyltransferase ASH1L [Exophiala viscosa]
MPLRQSLLSFYKSRADNVETKPIGSMSGPPHMARTASSTSSETDPDTIVVLAPLPTQLPTPSESSCDVSILDAQVVRMNQVPKGRARRVSQRVTRRGSQDVLVTSAEDESLKTRTVSGETLVNMDNASQSTLVKEGIAALDLPWNMSEVFSKGKKGVLDDERDTAMEDTVLTNDPEDEEEQRVREERAEAKKAKMEENNKLWKERRLTAEKEATRRSFRMPVLERAGGLVANIASTVLGKRKDRAPESRTSTRKTMGSMASEAVLSEPKTKKPRVSQAGSLLPEESPQPKTLPRRREKKWLSTGLYAGQPRISTENKNKRKSVGTSEPPRENKALPLPMYAGERLLKQGRDFKLPFDIFSPLPSGQPKPDEWKKVNKNVFVGDAAQFWRVSKFEEHSSCMCKPENGCDQDCMNRYMFYECDERNCNLTPEQCGNRPFEGLKQRVKKGGKYNVGVEVIKTEDRGYGVRSNRTFEPNQVIVEYTGEIITQEECEKRMHTMYKKNECYYLMLFDQNMIIDATRGSIARFVNHSCAPNCRMEKWTVNGKPRMALFAGDRGIMTGEELTYDYNFDPYSQKNVQACRCGADNCRGVLGPRSKEERKQKSSEEEVKKSGKLAGAKRKITEAIEEGVSRITKKAKIAAPKAKVYKSTGNSPIQVRKVKLIKQVVSRKGSMTALGGLTRQPSKLGRLVATAKSKTIKARVVSTSSSKALIPKENPADRPKVPVRSSSLREKASSVRSRVVRTVRGGNSGKDRTIRTVMDEDEIL